MIDRISSPTAYQVGSASASAGNPAQAAAKGIAGVLNSAQPIGTPLREVAAMSVESLASVLGRGGNPVATAGLERAALGFGREVKALAIGRPDLDISARNARIDQALQHGSDAAAALPQTFDPVDRAIALFDRAAAHLGQD